MKLWLARIAKGLLVAFLLIQVIRPDKTNPVEDPLLSIERVSKPPREISEILNRSCMDCHSHRSRWPWYSQVAPVSWYVIDHVKEARMHVNFSTWGAEKPEDRNEMLEDMCKEVKAGAMPIESYTWMHEGTSLMEAQRQALCAWTDSERKKTSSENGKSSSSEEKPDDHSGHKH